MAFAVPAGGAAQYSASVELVRVGVGIFAPEDDLVPKLAANDFRVFDNGVEQRIELFLEPEDTPLHVALVVDASGSMEGVWPQVVRSATQFLGALRPRDCAFVLPFEDAPGPGRWGRPRSAWAPFLEQAERGGGTALREALAYALRALELNAAGPPEAAPNQAAPPTTPLTTPTPLTQPLPRASPPLPTQPPPPATPPPPTSPPSPAPALPSPTLPVPATAPDSPPADPSRVDILPRPRLSLLAATEIAVTRMIDPLEPARAPVPDPDPGGCAALDDPEGPQLFGQQARRAVVLLSDGRGGGSHHSLEEIFSASRSAEMPIFTVILGNAGLAGTREMIEIARVSGGLVVEARGAPDLFEAFDTVMGFLDAMYVLAYRVPAPASDRPSGSSGAPHEDEGWHDVRVELVGLPHFRALHAAGYRR